MKKIYTYIMCLSLGGVAMAGNAAVQAASGSAGGEAAEGAYVKAMTTPSMLRVDALNVEHHDSTLRVEMEINPKKVKPGRDNEVVFTPVIRSAEGADSIVLTPMTVAGRNRYYSHLRNGDIEDGELIYTAGKGATIRYSRTLKWEPWMENALIYMREETQNCCKPVKPLCDTPLAQLGVINPPAYNATNARYIALTGDSTVELEAQGSAFIDFVVNRTEIKEGYRGNRGELAKIIASIDKVKQDPDATITRLTIKGYASPEGSYSNNVRLAMGRTQALKEYVREKYDFDPEIMHTDYEPEDWDGLRRWLDGCTLPHRDEIIEIVNSRMEPDPKDAEIKRRYPKEYKLILDSVYPALRHSDYTVRYKIRTYVDIEELKRVYRDTPERLRPVDFYRIAETFPVGSREYESVLLTASDIYPRDEQASVNAANILMKRGELEEASRRASRAGESGEAYYTRAMLALKNGDTDRAGRFFRKAQELGVAAAAEELRMLEASKRRETVTYLIEVEE